MKKILGLDLGSTSIGWAFLEENNEKLNIKKMGVRVVPYTGDENDKFIKGQAVTVNKDTPLKRTARKNQQRYKQRKQKLIRKLTELGMLPSHDLLVKMSPLELYALRAKAVKEKLTLQEIGRVIFHLNQKRGYRGNRFANNEEDSGKKMSDYLGEMQVRKSTIQAENKTIGQYFYAQLNSDRHFRTKQQVFPRECYIDEFNRICKTQSLFYPELLNNSTITYLRDEVVYYQRNLKSQKGLVSECAFEKHHKVAPKSSPLFQLEKIWESIHNITLVNKKNERYPINMDQKLAIFNWLDTKEKLTSRDLLKILDLKSTSGWTPNEQIKKSGLQGNTTKTLIIKVLQSLELDPTLFIRFDLKVDHVFNKETGEVKEYSIVDASFEKEPLYQLWHVIYSIDDPIQLNKVLMNKFGFSEEQASVLNKIDFKKQGFGNKSARAIRKLLPQLMSGMDYTRASSAAGFNHSNSITAAENDQRELNKKLELYKRNSLRQPVVEKVMNQLVNVVNAILVDDNLGRPDEIRIELARELRQSKEERERTQKMGDARNKEHLEIISRLNDEFPGMAVTGKVLEKYKLFVQQDGECMYSGKRMELSMVLKGEGVDIDHIIPQSRMFDDSFQNKVLVFRKLNQDKNNQTAFDYLKGVSNEEFDAYLERVERLYSNSKISRAKRQRLLMSEQEIPNDFISRQLNETRFISKEASKLLKQICRNVYSTSGSVTEFLRNQWGYNEVLKQLNYSKYEQAGLANDGKIDKDKWSKRDDHRHHAIDALVVAATKQGVIQKLNTLNSSLTRDELLAGIEGKVKEGWQAKRSLLEQYIQVNQPFDVETVKKAVSEIIISIKAGKKVATKSINKSNGQITLVPRGQLHKEFVYGKIKRYSNAKTALNGRFKLDFVEQIVNAYEKECIKNRLEQYGNDPKKAFKNLEKNPIWLNPKKNKQLTEVTLWEEHFVIKYDLNINFKEKDIESIVDHRIKELIKNRFAEKTGSKEHPLKDIQNNPIWLDKSKGISIQSVRCFTGLNDLVPLHASDNGYTFAERHKKNDSKMVDYVAPRNNHHIAIYKKPDGTYADIAVTLWEAVKRKQLGLPVIINDASKTWSHILDKGIDDQDLLVNIPIEGWEYIESFVQNDYFILGLSSTEIADSVSRGNLNQLSKFIYRVQKLSRAGGVINISFRQNLETRVDDNKMGGEMLSKKIGKLIVVQSLGALFKANPKKVFVDSLGYIKLV